MSKLEAIAAAIESAIDDEPMSQVLATVAGCLVGLMEGLAAKRGFNPDEAMTINGGVNRDITIHAVKLDKEQAR